MHDDERWQTYNDNGTIRIGESVTPAEAHTTPGLIVGNAHVWFWKKSTQGIEVLLQKRADTKKLYPGMYHISAGGHINSGETAVEAAVRETAEEMGIELDRNKLHFIGSMRVIRMNPNDVANVFLYELTGDETFTLVDGEAESYEWKDLATFKAMTLQPADYSIVDQGPIYFGALVEALEYAKENASPDLRL